MKKWQIVFLIIMEVLITLGGWATDIIIWTRPRPADQPGHGVPFFFFVGFVVAFIFAGCFCCFCTLHNDKKNKEGK